MKSELIPLNGDPPIRIDRDVTVIGRREFCDVVVEHPSLSKRHCVLVRTDGLLVVRDLVSTNGTKVNGQRVMWAALLPNDRLTLGRVKYKVYLGPDDVASPSERYARAGAEKSGVEVPSTVSAVSGFPRPPSSVIHEAKPGSRHPTVPGFPAPSPLSMPALYSPGPTPEGSTDPDADADEIRAEEEFDLLDSGAMEVLDDDDQIVELE